MSSRDDAVSLTSYSVDQALVLPTFRLPEHPNTLFMGVVDSSGDVLDDSLLDRRSGERGGAVPEHLRPAQVESTLASGIYCGTLYYHYGHFLLESLARMWYARQAPTEPLVWVGAQNWKPDRQLHQWQREILEILGITNPVVIVTSPTRVTRLAMPEIGYRYDDWCHPEHARFLATYHGPDQDESVRVWLSRSRVAKDVRDLNATAIERRLASSGWTIAYPEEMSVRAQLDTMSRAAVVAGEEGSAFHSLLLLDDVSGKKFHVMRRLGGEHRNMHTVGDVRGVDQTFHSVTNELVINAAGRHVTKISANSSQVLAALAIPVAEDAPGATDDRMAEIVSAIAERTSAASYLEVDVTAGSALPLVDVPRRTAVSAHLPIDPRAHETDAVRLYEIPLEGYLAHFDDWGDYDIVRVSAPRSDHDEHVILDAMTLAHPRTVWLVELSDDAEAPDDPLERLHRLLPSLHLVDFTHRGAWAALARRDPSAWRPAQPAVAEATTPAASSAAPRTHVDSLDGALDAVGASAADLPINVERQNRDLRAERDEQAQRISDQDRELDRLRRELAELQATNADLSRDVADLRREVTGMLTSTSWVITRPVRSASDVLRRLRG